MRRRRRRRGAAPCPANIFPGRRRRQNAARPCAGGADDFRLPARFALAQGPRDDASIVPYAARIEALPDFAGHSLRKAAMHPSVGFAASSPCRGAFPCGSHPQSLPCKGRCRRRRRRGAAPGPAIILSGRRSPCVGADALHRPASLRHRKAPRDDASIVPYEAQGKVLPGFAGHFCRQAAMHPSVCALRRIHRPVCGARIARRALKHACALRPSNLLRLAFSAAGGARLRSPLQGRLFGGTATRKAPL